MKSRIYQNYLMEKSQESKYYMVIIIDHFVIATDFENLFFLMNEIMRVDL